MGKRFVGNLPGVIRVFQTVDSTGDDVNGFTEVNVATDVSIDFSRLMPSLRIMAADAVIQNLELMKQAWAKGERVERLETTS